MPWLLTRIVFQKTGTIVVSHKVLKEINLSKDYSKRRGAKYLLPVCQNFCSENPGAKLCILNFEIAVQYLPEFGNLFLFWF